MRTFTEYINEARHDYIFGGTDDRNTRIDGMPFRELQDGDEIYWWYASDRNLIRKLAFSEWLSAGNNKARFSTQCGDTYTMINLDMDSNVWKWNSNTYVASTSLDELIKAVNCKLFHVSEDSVISEEEYLRKKQKA